MRYFCRVEYVGTEYAGWQIQNEQDSIQSELERAFSLVARTPSKVVGAGRTDTGVHAKGQGMHIDLPLLENPKNFVNSINSVLPNDIAIYNFQEVVDTFHARYSAIERCYKFYLIETKKPLWNNRAYHITFPINWNIVTRNIPYLIGTHDFTSFCASGSSTKSKICTVNSANLEKKNGTIYIFTIRANRFVYKMVRSIMGTLLDIGRGKITESLNTIINSKNRAIVGQTAPPHGLVLDYVTYLEVL